MTRPGAAPGPAGDPDTAPPRKLKVGDVLRADVSALHEATKADPYRKTAVLRLTRKLIGLLEHHGEYRMKVVHCPPLPLLWSFLPGDGSPASVVHKAYLRALWRERGVLARGWLLLQTAFLWPVVNLVLISWATWLNGRAIRKRTGVSIARQVLGQLQVSAVHAILAPWYYTWDLHDDAKRRQAGNYLTRQETKGGIYRLLKWYLNDDVFWSVLRDKAKYAEMCRDFGVRAIPVIAIAEDGEMRTTGGGSLELPDSDLFLKPTRGRGGEGADWWGRDAAGGYTSSSGRKLTQEQLIEHIQEMSLEQPYLVTPRVTNPPEIADLSNGVLCTARILTILNEKGSYEATDAVFRMAVGTNTVVDNFHAGGIASAVDMETGELGPATDLGVRPERGWCDTHPDTGAQITGRKLPRWSEAIDLVQRGHAMFADRFVIGWDVAILQDGPCVIESNGRPDLEIHQRCHRRPMGDDRFGELLAHQVERALAANRAKQAQGIPS